MGSIGYGYPIVPAHLLAHSADLNKDPFGSHPIGTGPYRLVQWTRGERLKYVANDRYFLGKPRIRNIDIAIVPDTNTEGIELREHQIDTAAVESSLYGQLRGVSGLSAQTFPYNDFNALALNVTTPILSDVRVRRAIAMSIDRENLVKKNTHGTGVPAFADLPAFLWTSATPPNPVAYNPAGAKALLDAAGWRVGPGGIRTKNGVPLRLQGIDYAGSITGRNLDVQIQQMLRDAGIQISWKYYSTSLYYAPASEGGPINRGNFDVADYSIVGNVDPENDVIYTCANRSPAGLNAPRYCSRTMDALQAASLRETDPAKRLSDITQIEKLAVTDVPYAFTYHTPWRIITQSALHRTAPNLATDWYDVWEWTKD
jgi:peptide/nickel transport system substrate-binding protein